MKVTNASGMLFFAAIISAILLFVDRCQPLERGVVNRELVAIENEGRQIMEAIRIYRLENNRNPRTLEELNMSGFLGYEARWEYEDSPGAYLLISKTNLNGIYICIDREGRLSLVDNTPGVAPGSDRRHR